MTHSDRDEEFRREVRRNGFGGHAGSARAVIDAANDNVWERVVVESRWRSTHVVHSKFVVEVHRAAGRDRRGAVGSSGELKPNIVKGVIAARIALRTELTRTVGGCTD